jgi:putative heme-binding domain-containing protein
MNTLSFSFFTLWATVSFVVLVPRPVEAVPPDIPPANAAAKARANLQFQRLREAEIKPLDADRYLPVVIEALLHTESPATESALLKGMLEGLVGRRDVSAPAGWSEVSERLGSRADEDISRMALRLGQIFGDEAANERALATLKNRQAPLPRRREALRSLITQQYAGLPNALKLLIADDGLRLDAIRAYASFKIPDAPGILLSKYSQFDEAAQRAVVETLASRKEYAQRLETALKSGKISSDAIPTYVARSLIDLLGESFTEVYGDIEGLSEDKEALIAKYKALLTEEALAQARPRAGRMVFERTCSACHVLYGEGGKIGPELTGSNRGDLDYILLNMLDPSGDIPDAYKLVTITTKDGQFLAGTIAEEDDQRVVLNSVGLKSTVLKSDIESREASPFSMMPEGLLLSIPDNEVINLVSFLRTTEPIASPK